MPEEKTERVELAEKLRALVLNPEDYEWEDALHRAADLLCGGGQGHGDEAVVLNATGLSGILEWRSGEETQENIDSMVRRLHALATDLEDEEPLELILRPERSNLHGDEATGGGKENSPGSEATKQAGQGLQVTDEALEALLLSLERWGYPLINRGAVVKALKAALPHLQPAPLQTDPGEVTVSLSREETETVAVELGAVMPSETSFKLGSPPLSLYKQVVDKLRSALANPGGQNG